MKVTYELRQFVSKKLFPDSKLGFKTIKVFETEQDAWEYKTKLEKENPDTIYSITGVILLHSVEDEKEDLKEFVDNETKKN